MSDWPICKCGCGLRTGGGRNLTTGARVGPPDTDATIADLQREVRRWKFNAGLWEDESGAIRKNMARHNADDRARLARVWKLVDRNRKTLRMEDLRAALEAPVFLSDQTE